MWFNIFIEVFSNKQFTAFSKLILNNPDSYRAG